jgi:hypothetical protein
VPPFTLATSEEAALAALVQSLSDIHHTGRFMHQVRRRNKQLLDPTGDTLYIRCDTLVPVEQ